MLRNALALLVQRVVDDLVAAGRLGAGLPRVTIEDPKDPSHGDFATNFAMVASKSAGMPPRVLAELLVDALLAAGDPMLESVEVAGPGFVNFRMNPQAVAAYVGRVNALGVEEFRRAGAVPVSERKRINIEFVSVNPNGPITIGSGRGAAFGSTLANVLDAAGHEVHREYYINDGVNSEQMRAFAESVAALIEGREIPEGGYRGDYVADVAHRVAEIGFKGDYQDVSQQLMLDRQQADLAAFGVEFDTWFSEQSLHDSGVVEREIEALKSKGAADERPFRTKLKLAKGGVIEDVLIEDQASEDEGDMTPLPSPLPAGGEGETETPPTSPTLWLRSTKFGDDMDRVMRRKDGRLTYIASDVAYHKDKFSRPANADQLITILGPDHHGYIGRLHAVLAAIEARTPPLRASGEGAGGWGENPPVEAKLYASPAERDACHAALAKAREELDVVIYQLVRFLKDGKPAPMRKRDGNIYALIDLIDEIGRKVLPESNITDQRKVGKDVARFFYLMRSHDTTFDFDLDLAEKQSDENPVFYVQYAHARLCGVLRKAAEAGLTPPPGPLPASGEGEVGLHLLVHPKETALIKKIVDLPHEVARAAEDYGVHRLTTYAIELARAYHHFYDACRVIQPEQNELSWARLALCEATQTALRATFSLLGIEAPEQM